VLKIETEMLFFTSPSARYLLRNKEERALDYKGGNLLAKAVENLRSVMLIVFLLPKGSVRVVTYFRLKAEENSKIICKDISFGQVPAEFE
jgi:hypothetical protein